MKYAPLKTEVFEAKDLEKAVELKSPRGWNIPYISNVSEGHRMVLLCLHGFGGGKGKKKWATRRRPPIFLIKIKYNPYLPNEKDNTSMLLCQALDCHRLTVRETIFPSSASQVTM